VECPGAVLAPGNPMANQRFRVKAAWLVYGVVALLGVTSTACHHDRPAEGPAQRAGEKVDNAAADTKDAVKDSAHDVKHDVEK
jgi:hypothetical protein